MAKQAVNIRLDSELLNKFDAIPGTRTSNLEEAMQMYIRREDYVKRDEISVKPSVEIQDLQKDLRYKDEIITLLNARIDDLNTQLGWFHQYALSPPTIIHTTTEEKKRHWWQRKRKK